MGTDRDIRRLCAVAVVALSASVFAQSSANPVGACPIAPPVCSVATKPADQTTSGFWDRENVLPPLVWGCNDEWKLQFGGSQMFRFENRRNFDMRTEVDDDDHMRFERTLLNVDVVYDSLYRVYLEVIDADVKGAAINPLQSAEWDMLQAFVDLKDCKDSPWTLRLGRQLLPIHPEGRVYGRPPVDYYWFNFLPVFDGAMLFYKTQQMEVQTFFLQPVQNRELAPSGRVYNDNFSSFDSRWFYGSIATFKDCAPHEYEFYFFGQRDNGDYRDFPAPLRNEAGQIGEGTRYTAGWRARGPIKKWEGCGTLGYGLEAAYQFGDNVGDEIQAHMLHADLNYTWEHPWKPKVTLLGNLASGDDKLDDGKLNTFDPLYGASHYGYGTIDFFRLSNMREVALTGEVRPTDKLRFLAEVHKFWLDSSTDAWNTALGGTFGRDPSGGPGREGGTELDFTAYYQPNKRLSFEAGVAHFVGGEYLESQGRNDHANFLFVQTTFKF